MTVEHSGEPGGPANDLQDIEVAGGRIGWLAAADGSRLRHAYWPALTGDSRPLVLLLGFTEFIEKYLDVVERLRRRGFAVWMMDWRGQGLSQRPLADRQKPHINDFAIHEADLALFMRAIVAPACRYPPVILAHSMGAHIALRWLHEHPSEAERAVLIAPMIDLALGPTLRILARWLAWSATCLGLGRLYAPGASHYGPDRAVFAGNRLTSDPERFQIAHRLIARNPLLSTGGPTLGWLDAAFRSMASLRRPGFPEGIRTPILLVQAGRDSLVSSRAQARLGARLPQVQVVSIGDSKHEVLKERDELQRVFWSAFDRFVGKESGEG
ncbi:MAG: alpha/beta hydrolase [Proteobacteria bacterium]|nr:alpha/beta hydrolase [Pseudomonadota bacterium]MBI3497335.1 alpha/beta hydrolase [Pseudomonadota bacterium]